MSPGARAALLVALCAVVAACDRRRPAEPAPKLVVWLVVDTLRADAIGAYGLWERFSPDGEGGIAPTPHLDAFAREEAVLFERAYAASSWTVPSIVTQATGKWPFEHGVLRLLAPVPAALVTAPEVFRAGGWRTGGVSTNFVIRALYGYDQGFESFDDDLAIGHEGTTVDAALARTLAQLDAFDADPGRGRFLWALWFDPHWRYLRHPGLGFGAGFGSRASERYQGDVTGGEEVATLRARARSRGADALTDADADFLRGLYQSEVAATDRAFGRLRAELVARGLWEDALVVVTSDHGEELLERGWLGHTTSLGEALVRVPLLVKPPGPARPARIAAPVSQVDLAATVLELAGLDQKALDRPADSPTFASLVRERAGAPPREFLELHVDFSPVLSAEEASTPDVLSFGVVHAPSLVKWVVDHRIDPPRGRLHDLARDPAERTDLAADDPFPQAARALALRRGLLPEPLAGRSGAVRIRGSP